jgi:protein-S-isoprenylcysteine O-methyltransferase Ste14
LSVAIEVKEMHLFDQKILGIMMLFLLGILMVFKRGATGSVLDKPKGNFLVRLVNSFNLFFLLIVAPFTAVLLMTRHLETIDPAQIIIADPWLLVLLEIVGLVFYVAGFFLMVWALICLGDNYQIGGTPPRVKDKMIMHGPFRIIRHPMYTAALSISLGLAGLTQSWALFGVFSLYLIFILVLIPLEEYGLRQVYDRQYIFYQQKTKKLIPFVY